MIWLINIEKNKNKISKKLRSYIKEIIKVKIWKIEINK
jgi:hypothetical protein